MLSLFPISTSQATLHRNIGSPKLHCTPAFATTITWQRGVAQRQYARRIPGAMVDEDGTVLLLSHLEMNAAVRLLSETPNSLPNVAVLQYRCGPEVFPSQRRSSMYLATMEALYWIEQNGFVRTNHPLGRLENLGDGLPENAMDGVIAALCYHGECNYKKSSRQRLPVLLQDIPDQSHNVEKWVPDFVRVHDLVCYYEGSPLYDQVRALINR